MDRVDRVLSRNFERSAENAKNKRIWLSEFFGSVDKFEPSLSFRNNKSRKIPYHYMGVMNKKTITMIPIWDLNCKPSDSQNSMLPTGY